MPERQAQRLISQYDGEQLQLESRVSELEKAETDNVPKKADINKFIALIRKYQTVTEVTDTMLYEFIDRVEVHVATGGSTRYRQQIIDIHFNFIGQFMPPGSVLSEEERIAMIDAEYKAKQEAKSKRSSEKRMRKIADLKKQAETDPQAAAKLRAKRDRINNWTKEHKAELVAQAETDPEAAAKLADIRARQVQATQRWKAKQKELAKTVEIGKEELNETA